MSYWWSNKVGMKYWNLHEKFHMYPSRINGWYGRGYHGNMLRYFYWCMFLQCTYYRCNQCVCQIVRSIGATLTSLENMQKSYVSFDVTWRKNGISYVIASLTLLIYISITNILQSTRNLKRYDPKCVLYVFCEFDLDLWPMFYFFITHSTHEVLESPCEVS